MTRIYDINTGKFVSYIFQNGYYVDGKKPSLPQNIVELLIIDTPLPLYDINKEKIESEWQIDLEKKQYINNHTVRNLSQYEIDIKDWPHPDFSKRIIAPKQLIFDDTGIKMLGWFQVNGLPIESRLVDIRLYCTVILPQHEAGVDAYKGIITIENRPEP